MAADTLSRSCGNVLIVLSSLSFSVRLVLFLPGPIP